MPLLGAADREAYRAALIRRTAASDIDEFSIMTASPVPVQAPAFIVYLCGHLRTFPLISRRMRQQWDTFARGAPYLVFMHTWSEIDHRRKVWWRMNTGDVDEGLENLNARTLLKNVTLNALASHLAAAQVEVHPGLEHFRVDSLHRGSLDEWCDRGTTCVSGA